MPIDFKYKVYAKIGEDIICNAPKYKTRNKCFQHFLPSETTYIQCSVIISFLIFLLQMAGSNSTSTREKLLGLVDDIELITKEIFENAIAPKVINCTITVVCKIV